MSYEKKLWEGTMKPHRTGRRWLARLLKYIGSAALCILCFWFGRAGGDHALAAEVKISDGGNFFSTEELAVMEQNLDYILERYDVSVYLITSDKIGRDDNFKTYLKKQKKKIDSSDMLLLFASGKKKQELCSIQAFGKAKKNLTGKRIAGLEASVESRLKNQDYMEACSYLSGKLLGKMGTKPMFDMLVFHPVFQLFVCLLFVTGVMFLLLHRFEKTDQKRVPYLNEKYSTLIGQIDHFSHISVKMLKKKKGRRKTDE